MVLLALAFGIGSAGYDGAARAIFWQNSLLQASVGGHEIGTPEKPILEATPLNLFAFYASIPLGVAIYGCLGFFLIPRLRRRA